MPAATTLIDVLRCAITDRTVFSGDESQRQNALLRQVSLWARKRIDLIQLREKDLTPADLTYLAIQALAAIAAQSSPTRLLINGSFQAALDSRAHGLHLPSHSPLLPDDVRRRYLSFGLPHPTVTVSCHSLAEVHIAHRNRADAILFAPVFGKTINGQLVTPAAGLEALREACLAAAPIPVYALGGVTEENAPQCLAAGAAGIAGIRLFTNVE
ncbi:MAG TPA: thiamine phosphate synthase [Edaphobacter sp.]|nr:thiamine phosphate synthase [Edaphobacter sp.]